MNRLRVTYVSKVAKVSHLFLQYASRFVFHGWLVVQIQQMYQLRPWQFQ
jgi:hypothetical protein